MSKMIQIFLTFFSLKNFILGAHILLLTFFENFNFWTTLFSKMKSNFWRLLLNWRQDLKTFLGWLLVLGLKECLVECATLCVKGEVMLLSMLEKQIWKYKFPQFWFTNFGHYSGHFDLYGLEGQTKVIRWNKIEGTLILKLAMVKRL